MRAPRLIFLGRRAGLVGLVGLVGLGLAGCAPRGLAVTPEHPASPDAPAGRLAGPPPALRPGVADPPSPSPSPAPAKPPAPHDHRGHH